MMHDSALHLTEDERHDAADATPTAPEGSRAARHLMHCARCRADVDRIRELLALAASLPRAIEPPADLWPTIQTRIRSQPAAGVVAPAGDGAGAPALPGATPPTDAGVLPSRRVRWESFAGDRRWLAAAAVLLIVASSALTMMFVKPSASDLARGPDAVAPAPGGAPVVRTVSDDYERLDRELATALAAQRDKMQPETVAKVERNLAIIDAAIAEIRQALVEDPGNDALRELLKASYGQKSALVRQVSSS